MPVSTPETVFPYIRHRPSARSKRDHAEYTRNVWQEHFMSSDDQYPVHRMGEEVYVIEVNPAFFSRTVPYISKVTGIPIVTWQPKSSSDTNSKIWAMSRDFSKTADYIAIKMPVFSFEKIRGADISLGPEMKSTGECLGIARPSTRLFTKHSSEQESTSEIQTDDHHCKG